MNLYGLEAINNYNGWSMAVVGSAIVFASLVILSIVIAQIHKIVEFFENRKRINKKEITHTKSDGMIYKKDNLCHQNSIDAIQLYNPLFEQLGESFKLAELYKISNDNNFPHPHLTIKRFRQEKVLIPKGDGFFTWSKQPPA